MLPERIRKPFARLFHWHTLHKGESVCHFLYLSATVLEGHGFHALFAGGVAVFVVMSSIAFHRSGGAEGGE